MTAASACDSFDSGSPDDGFGASFVADALRGWRKGPPYLSPLSLCAPRLPNPEPDQFWLAVVSTNSGTPMTEIKYEVFTMPSELFPRPERAKTPTGHGEVKVQRSAGALGATFRGEAADGVRI